MENSIEEDIKIIENILHKGYTMSILHPSTNIKESEIKALEHILSDYKRVLKENESWKSYSEELEEKNTEISNKKCELEFDVNCDWITLQKILDESEKSNEYILYKNEKWIKEKYCIPVQKVKDKIEEIDKIYNDIPEDEGNFAKAILIKEKQVLQELLEGRK